MKKSEELRLLLSYNKKELKEYQLRKQLSLEMTHPNTLLFHASLEDLFRIEYGKDNAKYYLLKNPLMYDQSWPKDIQSIRQFYVQTKDSNRLVSMNDIIEHPSYKGIGLKRILQDIFATYIEEYNQAYLTMLKRVKKLYYMLPKNLGDSFKKYRKKIWISFLIFLCVFSVFLLPEEGLNAQGIIHQTYQEIFSTSSIVNTVFITIGRVSLLLYLVYFMLLYSFRLRMKDIDEMELLHRNFDEENLIQNQKDQIDKNILHIQLFIEKIEDNNRTEIDLLKALDFTNDFLRDYQEKLALTHKRNDHYQKLKPFYQKSLHFLFYFSLSFASIFFFFVLAKYLIEVIGHV